MRVILTSHGSTGDIYPVIALAVALQNAGHQVRFATTPHHQAEIEAAGVEFYPLCPTWTRGDLSYWMGRLQEIRLPIYQLREIYVSAGPHIREMIARLDEVLADADLLVSSYLFPMNKRVADRRGVPFATLAFTHHIVPSDDYPPEGIPSPRWLPRKLRRAWNRGLWKIGDRLVDRLINRIVRADLRALGLPEVHGFFSAPAERVLVTVSEELMRNRDAEIDARFRFTGYCRWQSPVDPHLEAGLTEFCAGENVPVLTFGSMVDPEAAQTMRRLVRAWPRERKLIVQRGWAEFPELGDCPHIRVIGKVSHDQLFRHASAIIHHGGAGTTASALHAGRPQIVVPHIGDQNFFGMEVERLGCGFRLDRHHWPERLHEALDRLASTGAAENAARAQAILLRDNGPARAVAELEQFVDEQRRTEKPASRVT